MEKPIPGPKTCDLSPGLFPLKCSLQAGLAILLYFMSMFICSPNSASSKNGPCLFSLTILFGVLRISWASRTQVVCPPCGVTRKRVKQEAAVAKPAVYQHQNMVHVLPTLCLRRAHYYTYNSTNTWSWAGIILSSAKQQTWSLSLSFP